MTRTKRNAAVVGGALVLLATIVTILIVTNSESWQARTRISRAKRGIPMDPTAVAQAAASSKVLIFRNIRSWNRKPDFEETLTALGFKFDVKPSAKMAVTDLSAYDLVIIPGAQWRTGFYQHYAENAQLFDSYVSNGGTLLLELNGAEDEGLVLPGAVSVVKHFAKDNALIVPEHPILIPMGGKPIHANYASHCFLMGAPANAIVLAAEINSGKTSLTKPTFLEYTRGSGRVIAACQCFHDQDGSERGVLMRSTTGYAAVKKWFSPK